MDGGVCLSSMTCFCWCISEVKSNHVSIYPHQLLILFLVSQTQMYVELSESRHKILLDIYKLHWMGSFEEENMIHLSIHHF